MITYRATLDVPEETVAFVSREIAAHRKAVDHRPWQRAATPYMQAVMVLRWLRGGSDIRLIARDARVSDATGYRYIHEAVDIIAAHAPDLRDVLESGGAAWDYVCLDGTLIASTRSSERSENGHDLWYSGKHRHHGGNIQVLADPTGFPIWVSGVEPGSTHDINAARRQGVTGALYAAASTSSLVTLADKGYEGAGIGIETPTKGHHLHPDTACRNRLLSAMRAPAERANALLKKWKVLRRVTVCPWRIGTITAAVLVLLHRQAPAW